MEIVNIHHAKTHLSRLLEQVARGEEVIIAKAGHPVARLVPFATPHAPRHPGSAVGQFEVPDSFFEPLPDELMTFFS
jgi:prevent-host-death family protein